MFTDEMKITIQSKSEFGGKCASFGGLQSQVLWCSALCFDNTVNGKMGNRTIRTKLQKTRVNPRTLKPILDYKRCKFEALIRNYFGFRYKSNKFGLLIF